MQHYLKKIDELHDEYHIILEGGTDEARFGRVFNAGMTNTHRLKFREDKFLDGATKRKMIVVWLEPLTLDEIAFKSDGFKRLSDAEVSALGKKHDVEGDRQTIVDGLSKPQNKSENRAAVSVPAVSEPKMPIVVSDEIRAMSPEDLETKAAVVGAHTKNWAKMSMAQRQSAVMAKLK